MKRILLGLGSIALALAIFTGGVYASQWLNFTGDEQITQSDDHVDEIMDILRQVNDGKITAEEAKLRLEGEVAQLTEEKGSLNDQLTSAQGDIEYLEDLLEDISGDTPGQKIKKLKEANDNLRSENAQLQTDLQNEKNTNEDLQTSITGLQEDIKTRDNTIQGLENDVADLKEQLANAPEDQTDYVAHLEKELERANNAVEQHNETTSKALEEAEALVGDGQE